MKIGKWTKNKPPPESKATKPRERKRKKNSSSFSSKFFRSISSIGGRITGVDESNCSSLENFKFTNRNNLSSKISRKLVQGIGGGSVCERQILHFYCWYWYTWLCKCQQHFLFTRKVGYFYCCCFHLNINCFFFVYRYIEFPVHGTRCKIYGIVPKDPPIVVRGKKQYWSPINF